MPSENAPWAHVSQLAAIERQTPQNISRFVIVWTSCSSIVPTMGRRQQPIGPRAAPKTERGRRFVDKVIEVTHRILAEDGYGALSTNRIAKLAGTSVGTLYHYFPSKEAIVAELASRLETRGLELARMRFMEVASWPLLEMARAFVTILMSDEIGIVSTRRTLLHHVPQRWFEEVGLAADREVRESVQALMALRQAEIRQGPTDVMAFIGYHAIEGVVEAAVRYEPKLMDDPQLWEELTWLLFRYVRPQNSSTKAADERIPS